MDSGDLLERLSLLLASTLPELNKLVPESKPCAFQLLEGAVVDLSRKSDPDENYMFSRDWSGAGYFHLRLAEEAARWLEARRKIRARSSTVQPGHGRIRCWRAST